VEGELEGAAGGVRHRERRDDSVIPRGAGFGLGRCGGGSGTGRSREEEQRAAPARQEQGRAAALAERAAVMPRPAA
jgi:hypothetical protein